LELACEVPGDAFVAVGGVAGPEFGEEVVVEVVGRHRARRREGGWGREVRLQPSVPISAEAAIASAAVLI